MAVKLQCPDNATLLRLFGQGGSHEEMESLARHVEQCSPCGERIDEILCKDELSLGLARPVDGTAMPDSEALINLRWRLQQLRPPASSEKTADAIGAHSTSASGSPFPATLPMSGADHGITFLAPPQLPDEIGRLGPYRVLKKLGAGGMGMVPLAEDSLLKRKVALKVMLPNIAVNPQARERFLREARAAAAIEHAHIIAIHHVGEDNGVPFLAMPLLKGESLDDRLKREKKLSINEAVRITCEMADGLAAAHAQGLIHRDIKPGNVWLEEQAPRAPAPGAQAAPAARRPAKVKVLDFGLARSQADEVQITQSGAIVGTPAFMAPEQARGLHVDARADLFSLGCVLYVMLIGRRPFTGESTMALLSSLALDTPKSPREVNPAVPAVLSDFTMRLLAKKPEERPASADAALDEMRGLIATAASPNAAPSPSTESKTLLQPLSRFEAQPIKIAVRPLRRRIAMLMGLVLLFLIGGGLAAYQLLFKTNNGTLIVDVDDDANVSFQKGELHIMGADGKSKYILKPSERNKTLPPGKYLIEVADVEGMKMDTDKFEIIRDGKARVRVTIESAVVATKKDADPDRRAAEWILSIGGGLKVNDQSPAPEVAELGVIDELPRQPFWLTFIDLNQNKKVSDASLAHFEDCKQLTFLYLNGTDVGDAGLVCLEDCKNLRGLDLSRTRISDAGLAHLRECKNLTQLRLEWMQVGNAGLAHFKDWKELNWVSLIGTRVDDAGLARLKEYRNRRSIWQCNTTVSDAGLMHLKDSTNLTELLLQRTKVTADGVKKLAAALPKCKITWDGGVVEPKP